MYLVEEKHDLQNTEPKVAGNGFFQMWDMKMVCSPHLLVNILRTTLKGDVCMFKNSPPLFFHCGNSKIDFTGIVSVRNKTLAE